MIGSAPPTSEAAGVPSADETPDQTPDQTPDRTPDRTPDAAKPPVPDPT